ncbi:glycosyltransferase [Parapedobacter tibetensis]|uniref:glycosyltransferase n=1 Tax=Parapedobacter tibetensis TaxID=2972951 RepID=UPI00214D7225|nr:glycosyltransferase [Parapedobacter tibetensis]
MRTLRIISSMDPRHGGPCQGIRNSIPALQQLGIENEVACLDDPQADFLGKDPFVIHALGQGKGSWAYQPGLERWLFDNIHHYDAVIIHGLWQYHSYASHKAITRYRRSNQNGHVPAIYVMPHGMLDPYFQQASGRRLKAIRNWLYWRLLEHKVINGADGLLFTCEAELQLAKLPFSPYRPKRELNIGYGITPPPLVIDEQAKQDFQRRFPQIQGKPFMLFLSRIHEKKGVDLLIKAYRELKKTTTQELPLLVVAGPGLETEFGQVVKQMAAEDTDIVFTGMLTGAVKWGAFRSCEAFVLPSHQENFGIAVVEALACGKPVLISKQVNIWKEIAQEGGGIVEEDSPNGVLRLFTAWSALRIEERTLMGERAKATYQKYFTTEQAAKRMADVLVNA